MSNPVCKKTTKGTADAVYALLLRGADLLASDELVQVSIGDTRIELRSNRDMEYLHLKDQRSSVHPNCSFFTNWTDEDDSITWDIEVLTYGLYEAQVYYTCKKGNVGAELELSFDDKNVKRKVTQAFDTPLVGAAEKKVNNRESLMKDFKALTLGTFRMPKKRGTLSLRATNIPGSEAVDLRYVTLRLKH